MFGGGQYTSHDVLDVTRVKVSNCTLVVVGIYSLCVAPGQDCCLKINVFIRHNWKSHLAPRSVNFSGVEYGLMKHWSCFRSFFLPC